MIRFLLRSLGLWMLAAGFVIFVYDGTKSIAASMLSVTTVEDIWNILYSKNAQDMLKPMIDRSIGEWLWDAAMLPFLHTPGSLVFCILGAILVLLGRKKKPLIGYAR
jgi:hypothetical protein